VKSVINLLFAAYTGDVSALRRCVNTVAYGSAYGLQKFMKLLLRRWPFLKADLIKMTQTNLY